MNISNKNKQEEMYLAVELWQESGLSQNQFCKREGLSRSKFNYWYKKCRGGLEKNSPNGPASIIPIKISSPTEKEKAPPAPGRIEITYPNGIHVACPPETAPVQLKALLDL